MQVVKDDKNMIMKIVTYEGFDLKVYYFYDEDDLSVGYRGYGLIIEQVFVDDVDIIDFLTEEQLEEIKELI